MLTLAIVLVVDLCIYLYVPRSVRGRRYWPGKGLTFYWKWKK